MKPHALVFSGYGLNCEEETKFAFETAGATADIVHINDLIDNKSLLKKYQIMAFPGGFAYGDDTGSGNAYANRLRGHLWAELETFAKKDHLIVGICNGFQILVNLGLLPALQWQYGSRQVGLLHNISARYMDRWVDIQAVNNSPWLTKKTSYTVPIAHGEGRLYASKKTLDEMKKKKCIALQYIKGEICAYQNLPANPNGSIEDIAGITDESGRILGLMPHPERAMFFTQLPNWPLLKEQYKWQKKQLPKTGPGLQIFKNAVNYFKK